MINHVQATMIYIAYDLDYPEPFKSWVRYIFSIIGLNFGVSREVEASVVTDADQHLPTHRTSSARSVSPEQSLTPCAGP